MIVFLRFDNEEDSQKKQFEQQSSRGNYTDVNRSGSYENSGLMRPANLTSALLKFIYLKLIYF